MVAEKGKKGEARLQMGTDRDYILKVFSHNGKSTFIIIDGFLFCANILLEVCCFYKMKTCCGAEQEITVYLQYIYKLFIRCIV